MSNPTQAEILESAFLVHSNNMHTCMPAEVVTYDTKTNTATVKPLIERSLFDDEGNESADEYPTIQLVPVVWPRSAGYVLRFPVVPGDQCLLMFTESDKENWQDTGNLSAPEDDRRFDLTDAVAYMGFFARPQEEATATSTTELQNGMVLGKDGQDSRIFIDDTKIELGGEGASDNAVLDSKLQIELDKVKMELESLKTSYTSFLTLYTTHQHAAIVPLIPLPGPQPLPTVITAPPLPVDPIVHGPSIPHTTSYTKGDTNSDLVTIEK